MRLANGGPKGDCCPETGNGGNGEPVKKTVAVNEKSVERSFSVSPPLRFSVS
jgi:hypothetical protein